MAAHNYSDKRFLIVDSLKPSRDVLKNLAFNLDPATVQASSYASDVITKCSEHSYDILLLGYDLGEKQKNGQQLLEELRVTGLINRNTVVILVTGEMSQAMVLAALEQKPDDYLTKPYTLKELTKRLHRCFSKKEMMRDIYTALDKHNSKLAIQLCDKAIDENTPYRIECLNIKSKQCFKLGNYKLASNIYKAHKDLANCQWAMIGLGRVALVKNQPEIAIKYFSHLKKKYPIYLNSYDWLATAQETLNQYIEAENTLEEAVTISPFSVKRVKRYADLCLRNGNLGKAASAFEQNYTLAFNSVHHCPDNALDFADAVNKHSDELSELELKVLKNKVVSALNETVKTFNHPPTKIQSQLLTVDLMNKTNEKQFAARLLDSTESLLEKTQDNITATEGIKIAKLLINLGRRPPANTLINTIVEKNHEEIDIMTEVDKLLDETFENKAQQAAQNALDDALHYYHAKQFRASIEKLEKARELFPRHLGIQLNLIQVLLTNFQENHSQNASLKKAGQLLNKMEPLSNNSSGFKRQRALEQKFKYLHNKAN